MKMLMGLVLFYFSVTPVSADEVHLVEDRRIEKLRREVMKHMNTYQVRITNDKKDVKMPVALPLFQLTEYAICSNRNQKAVRVGLHYEPTRIEAYFQCENSQDLVEWKEKSVVPYCRRENIRSKAQEVLCGELGPKIN